MRLSFLRFVAAMFVVGAMLTSTAGAVTTTFNIVGSFSGGQLGSVELNVDVTADFSGDIIDSNFGLTVNSLTSSVLSGDPFDIAGGLGYTYFNSLDKLRLGGLEFGTSSVSGGSNDFVFDVILTGLSPQFVFASNSKADVLGSGRSDGTVSFSEVSAVPLPAALPLFGTGLAVMGFIGWRRKRQVAATA